MQLELFSNHIHLRRTRIRTGVSVTDLLSAVANKRILGPIARCGIARAAICDIHLELGESNINEKLALDDGVGVSKFIRRSIRLGAAP